MAEVLERLSDVEHGLIVVEATVRKLHFRMMAIKSAQIRSAPEDESSQDAPGEAIPLERVAGYPPKGTGPLRNMRGF